MRNAILLFFTSISLFAFILSGCGTGRPNAKNEAKAKEILRQVEEYYSDKQHFKVDIAVDVTSFDLSRDHGTLVLLAEKSGKYRSFFEAERSGYHGIDICNGTEFWTARSQASEIIPDQFKQTCMQDVWDLSVCGSSIPGQVALSLMTPGWQERITENAQWVKYVGEEKVEDGRNAHHIRIVRELHVDSQIRRDWRDLWIALGDEPVILGQEWQLKTTTSVMKADFTAEYKEILWFTNWDFEPKIPNDAFVVPE